MKVLNATLDHFEEDRAVLLFEDGQKLRIAKSMVPGFVQGDIISLTISSEENAEENREKLLKGILNDIIDDEDGKD
ncbi:MAG: DUF3006 family protein [Patescibacteria group bacterium]